MKKPISPLVYSTDTYDVIVAISPDTKKECYQIVNRQYGVVEIESSIYPQAIKYAIDLEAGVAAMFHISEELQQTIN